ncbi:MAG: hypothetical protein RLO50_06445 [Azospirillaceae bacterium]
MRHTLLFIAAFAVMAGIGAGGFLLARQAHDRWQAGLVQAQQQSAERRAEQTRLAEAQAAAQQAAEAAASAAATRGPANPLAPSAGGGYNPLAPGGGYNPLAPRPVGANAPAATADLHPEFGLPDTEGVDVVYYACTVCHSAATFTMQHMTEARWDYTLDWMVETQGMNPMTPEDRSTALTYLVRHFGAGS